MRETLAFLRGPLFAATFLFMALGLARHVFLRTRAIVTALGRTPKRDVPWKKVFSRTAGWALPLRHVFRGAPVMSVASVLFHVGLLLVPVFLVDHVLLWSRGLGVSWPAIGRPEADLLTLSTLLTAAVLFLFRAVDRTARNMSRSSDFLLLVVVALPFLTGWFCAHPESSPLGYPSMMLLHVLSGELTFLLLPTTKLAHAVLFVFDRMSTDVFWRFVPGAGDRVAEALRGTKEGAEA